LKAATEMLEFAKTSRLMLLIFTIASLGLLLWNWQGVKSAKKKATDTMLKIFDATNGNYDLEGIITDKDGIELDGIKLEIEKCISVGFDQNEEKKEKKLVDKKFVVKENGYSSIRLNFGKEGYYEEILTFISRENNDNLLVNKNIKVILQKRGEQAKLVKYKDSLLFSYNGNAKVFSFEIPNKNYIKNIKNLEDMKTFSSPCIYVTADKDIEGNIVTEIFDEDCFMPKMTKLTINQPDAGFIIHNPNNSFQGFEREMLLAPEAGYQKEILIDFAALKNFKYGKKIFFWFKVKDKYGKGYVNSIDYRDVEENSVFRKGNDNINNRGKGQVRVNVNLLLNPDGTRNLEGKTY